MTPQELERLGIAITGTTNWIASLANVMGLSSPSVVRGWWTGKTKITATKQRKLFLLAGKPDAALAPIFDDTRNRLARIKAMLEQGNTYKAIGQEFGITHQAVENMATRYRLVTPMAESGRLKCPVCSGTFQPRYRTQQCCSARCGSRRRDMMNGAVCFLPQPCEECGTPFQPKTSVGRFCCQRCRSRKWNREYQRRLQARRHD
jgi:hypothetical protein